MNESFAYLFFIGFMGGVMTGTIAAIAVAKAFKQEIHKLKKQINELKNEIILSYGQCGGFKE